MASRSAGPRKAADPVGDGETAPTSPSATLSSTALPLIADAGLVVLAFQDDGLAAPAVSGAPLEKDADEAWASEQERRTTRTRLQSTIDGLQVANEEMKSSNEEFQSVNEELQSNNEDLETTKVEMQSVNEELQIVNAEMANKNRQLAAVNSDLKNLLESTEIATLFLDENLRVRRFTSGVNEIFHLREADVGRPITEIVSLLDYGQLQGDVRTVLRKLAIVEREVTLKDAGMTFILRIRPYRTIDNVIDGVVMTFVDITARHAVDAIRREAEAYLRLLIDSVADALYCMDRDGLTTLCNASFRRMFGFESEAAVIGVALHDVIHHTQADGRPYPRSQCQVLKTARTGEPAHCDDEVFFRVDGTRFPVEYWAQPILRGGVLAGAVCTLVDVTDRRLFSERQEMLLREMDHRIKNLFAMVGGAVTLSARSATTTKGMAETIHGRLGALAIAHQLIRPSRPDSGGVIAQSSLGELVRTILAPYMDRAGPGGATRVAVEGPEVRISGEAVTSLALVLHELATNAAKYGAFSTAAGRLRVSWKLEGDNLQLRWEESGGPMVAHAPEREGFGSLLARRSVSGQLEGQLTFEWNPEGLIVRIVAARDRLTPAMA